ncbi:hypothetical protein [Streptomyces sp. enrichment culture]|uniref:hypothetical protein n=1 Tax=Streptomyces sp. enrichment culture TaxID=1795815 RepID=UPI003F57C5D7
MDADHVERVVHVEAVLAVAAVRVGTAAITVTQGGLNGVSESTTTSAVREGTQRLKEVLAGRTPSPDPSAVD